MTRGPLGGKSLIRLVGLAVALFVAAGYPGHLEAARLTAAPETAEAPAAAPGVRPTAVGMPGVQGQPPLPTGLAPLSVTGPMLPPQAAGRLVTMDFRDVDLKELVKTISELTGRNFIIDNRVKGMVTVISPKQITVDEAYRVFLSVLEINGFTTVPAGTVIKIMPAADAGKRAVMTGRGDIFNQCAGEDKVVTQLVPLRYAECEDLRSKLQDLASPRAMVSYQPTNTLIITDLLSNIERLMKIIAEVDVEGLKEKLTVVPLRFAAARFLAETIEGILGGQAGGVGRITRPGMASPQGGNYKVKADERTNSLILLADVNKTQDLMALIDKLDVETPRGKDRVHVYYLENAIAEDLAKVLTGVIQDKGTKSTAGAAGSSAPKAAPIIEDVSIAPDKATNSLVITASPADYQVIEGIVKRLDVMRAQVLVEAFIAEVSFDKTRKLASHLLLGNHALNSTDGTVTAGGFNDVPSAVNLLSLLSGGGTAVGILRSVGSGIKAGALIEAIESDSDTNILSTPSILTMDNEEAEIVVGTQRPFLKSDLSSALAGGTETTAPASISKTFEYKDVGLKLKITPHITANKYVRMKLYQEMKDVLPTSQADAASGAISTTNRSANTTVMVQDGETVVIGGLIQEKRSESTQKVPCLGSLPLVGWAFRSVLKTKEKTNLIILITPHIVTSPDDIRTLTNLKRDEVNEITRQFHEESQQAIKRNLELLLQ